MVNENKVCFIICTNNQTLLDECTLYLSRLIVPDGIETELLTICDAASMLDGYKEASMATDAKYKVFLHQDVFIINKYFIKNMLEIFRSNDKIGMIGMVGNTKMPSDAIMWSSQRCGNIFYKGMKYDANQAYALSKDGVTVVDVVDGLLIATSVDIPFRNDLFDGWDFYDVSMSFEMQRAGYKVVVPNQPMPWTLHDDGEVLNMTNYNKYRQKVLAEYKDFFEE